MGVVPARATALSGCDGGGFVDMMEQS